MSRIAPVQMCLKRIHRRMPGRELRLQVTAVRLTSRRSPMPAHQMCSPPLPDLQTRLPERRHKAEPGSPKKMTKHC